MVVTPEGGSGDLGDAAAVASPQKPAAGEKNAQDLYEHLQRLAVYKDQNGDCNNVLNDDDLAQWVERQRQLSENGSLSAAMEKKLASLGIKWAKMNLLPHRRVGSLQELHDFRQKHSFCPALNKTTIRSAEGQESPATTASSGSSTGSNNSRGNGLLDENVVEATIIDISWSHGNSKEDENDENASRGNTQQPRQCLPLIVPGILLDDYTKPKLHAVKAAKKKNEREEAERQHKIQVERAAVAAVAAEVDTGEEQKDDEIESDVPDDPDEDLDEQNDGSLGDESEAETETETEEVSEQVGSQFATPIVRQKRPFSHKRRLHRLITDRHGSKTSPRSNSKAGRRTKPAPTPIKKRSSSSSHNKSPKKRRKTHIHRTIGLPAVMRPGVGTVIRKRYANAGWFCGKVVEQNDESSKVVFADGDVEYLTDEELRVTAKALELHLAPGTRPGVGAKVRKRYDGGDWFDGTVISQSKNRTRILFSDNGNEDLSDDELRVVAAAYALKDEVKKQPAVTSANNNNRTESEEKTTPGSPVIDTGSEKGKKKPSGTSPSDNSHNDSGGKANSPPMSGNEDEVNKKTAAASAPRNSPDESEESSSIAKDTSGSRTCGRPTPHSGSRRSALSIEKTNDPIIQSPSSSPKKRGKNPPVSATFKPARSTQNDMEEEAYASSSLGMSGTSLHTGEKRRHSKTAALPNESSDGNKKRAASSLCSGEEDQKTSSPTRQRRNITSAEPSAVARSPQNDTKEEMTFVFSPGRGKRGSGKCSAAAAGSPQNDDDDDHDKEEGRASTLSAKRGKVVSTKPLAAQQRPGIGAKLRKRFNTGWYDGTVESQDAARSHVCYYDGDAEYLTDGELSVAVMAHEMRGKPSNAHKVGTVLKKRFDSGWFVGEIISKRSKNKTRVKFSDGASENLTDNELEVAVAAAGLQILGGDAEKPESRANETPLSKSKPELKKKPAPKKDNNGTENHLAAAERPDVGTKIRKLFGGTWYDGAVEWQDAERTHVRYSDGDSEDLSDEELRVSAAAYEMKKKPMKRFDLGTKVRSKFGSGWFVGKIVSKAKNKAFVEFEDGGTEYLPNDELQVAIAAYQLQVSGGVGKDLENDPKEHGGVSENKDGQEPKAPPKTSDLSPENPLAAAEERPGAGAKVRKRFSAGWFDGEVVSQDQIKSHVQYSDGDSEDLTDDELRVAAVAYSLKGVSGGSHKIGTKVLKRFGKGWYDGTVISQTKCKSFVKFSNGGDDYLSDNELQVAAAAFKLIAVPGGTSVEEDSSITGSYGASSPEKSKTSANQTSFQRPPVGSMVRQRYTNAGWVDGEVKGFKKQRALVEFVDGTTEYLSNEELQVAVAAHKMHLAPKKGVPAVGTKVRKRFQDSWYNGHVISQENHRGKHRSYILYQDHDQEYVSDEELRVCAAAATYFG